MKEVRVIFCGSAVTVVAAPVSSTWSKVFPLGCTMFVPTLMYGALFLGKEFPRTERVQSGVSTGTMFRSCTSPLFILLVCCMLLSAATELGTNQWITDILRGTIANKTAVAAPVVVNERVIPMPKPLEEAKTSDLVAEPRGVAADVAATDSAPVLERISEAPATATAPAEGEAVAATAATPAMTQAATRNTSGAAEKPAADNSGILVLVWISGLMALGRQFAGPIVHRLSPTGMLLFSAIFSTVGLVWLSFADSTVSAFGAATVFSIGICYFWPTMIGLTSEKLPKYIATWPATMSATAAEPPL